MTSKTGSGSSGRLFLKFGIWCEVAALQFNAMISKRIQCEPQNDNIKRLGAYIGAGHEREKLFAKWPAGCYAGQDYDLAIDEIKATQAMNTRTKKEKTYHMVVSFHPEDFEKLSLEDFKNIEKEFAAALGFEEHQRLCGIHVNTDHPHMHVAYNMIHKERYTRHDPFYDYYKRDKTCRLLEEKYKLKIDVGVEQQFSDYVKQSQSDVKQAFDNARDWQSLHEELALYGLTVQMRGNGCILAAIGHKQKDGHHIKLSDFDKNLSKKKLQDRFGSYEKSAGDYEVKEFFQREPKRENAKAKDFETKTGLKSFETFVLESKEFIAQAAIKSNTWQDFHRELARIGLEVKPRGVGYVLTDIGGKTKKNSSIPFSKTGMRIAKNGIILERHKKGDMNNGKDTTKPGNLKILGKFESSQGDYTIENPYKFEPVKKFKSAKEREVWKIYIREQKRHNYNWLKFNKNFQRFYSEDYGL